jgi:hypothetical protein
MMALQLFSFVSGYDLVEWLMERFNLDETSNGECLVIGAGGWSRRRTPVESIYEKAYPQALLCR